MEDSGQRKRRLEEMRMQAELAEAAGGIEASGSGMHSSLSNPLIESAHDKSYAASRFDFYTDPMAAFSSNKKSNANVRAAPDYSTPPTFGSSPMAQFSSPNPPPPLYPGTATYLHLSITMYLKAESMKPQMTHSFSQGSPVPNRNPIWNGPRGFPHYNFPSHPSSEVSYGSPAFEISGRPLYTSGQRMIHQPRHSPTLSPGYCHSPSLSPGRGRGGRYNTRNDGSGWSGGRQLSSHGCFSNEDKPRDVDRFYKRSMVEDPWQLLKPVVWKVTDATSNNVYTPESSKSWASKSSSTNRGGPSAASEKSSSQPSLAEYLAAAFNEAANGTENA